MAYSENTTGYSKSKSRKGYTQLEAIDPHDGGRWDLLLADDKMDWVAKKGIGAAKELAYTVRWTLIHPRAIFSGVRDTDKDVIEDRWLCYTATPPKAYSYKTGQECPPWPNEVFNVYVTDERVLYLWYWDACDPQKNHLPRDYETRFSDKII